MAARALRVELPLVRQAQLRAYRELQQSIQKDQDALDKEVQELQAKYPALEENRKKLAALAADLFDLLDGGAEIEPGPRTAFIKETPGRVVPKYKEELEKVTSAEYIKALIARTPPGAPKRELIVDYRKA